MPYSTEHKQKTRTRIVIAARELFNQYGFAEVSIDQIMESINLTRGGFYNHFKTKEELFTEILLAFAANREEVIASVPVNGPAIAEKVVTQYLSDDHLENLGEHCPLMAVPSDVARAGPAVRDAYQKVFDGMAGMFANNVDTDKPTARRAGISIATICIGAMVLARTIDDTALAAEIRDAAQEFAFKVIGRDASIN